MTEVKEIDYGPLQELIGVWKGDKGMDIAPEPDGTEENPYYETITYTAAGDVTNAELQVLSVVHYRQIVTRKSNDEVFHDETGYWLWDPREEVIMHSLVIPRGVCLLAGANHQNLKDEEDNVIIEVEASIDNRDWGIVQSPFMQNNAKTTAFRHKIIVGNGKMSYSETTMLDIYGRTFEHTDQNELSRE
ncbi:MAG: FABP family protein [Cytophagales bacterium]|nr:FABP family protein [Cytophagales bacterium]